MNKLIKKRELKTLNKFLNKQRLKKNEREFVIELDSDGVSTGVYITSKKDYDSGLRKQVSITDWDSYNY